MKCQCDMRDRRAQVLVHELRPHAHARAAVGSAGTKRRPRESLVEVFIDDGGFADDPPVMHEHRAPGRSG